MLFKPMGGCTLHSSTCFENIVAHFPGLSASLLAGVHGQDTYVFHRGDGNHHLKRAMGDDCHKSLVSLPDAPYDLGTVGARIAMA